MMYFILQVSTEQGNVPACIMNAKTGLLPNMVMCRQGRSELWQGGRGRKIKFL